jgi:hypothetical protein
MLALFEKRIAGDDSLLELARRRFQESGLGAEFHAADPEQLAWLMKFRPSAAAPVVVHLPRRFNLSCKRDRERISELAGHAAGRVHGLVMHDHHSMLLEKTEFLHAAQEMESQLRAVARGPMLFIEYAAGLEPEQFAKFFVAIRDLTRLSACIDIGHVGIREIRHAFAGRHNGEDVCALRLQSALRPEVLFEIQSVVNLALPLVLRLIKTLSALGKPVHFHLHDGHPLSTYSAFGVSDHLSFLGEIPLSFQFQGRSSLPLIFGPNGLAQIAQTAVESLGPEQVSFTLEIHPTNDRLPLGDATPLFDHWRDKSNAEQMNHWLSVLARNHRLLADAINHRSNSGRFSWPAGM